MKRELEEKRAEFYEIIGEDLLKERKKAESSLSETEASAGIKPAEKVGTLIVPDLRKDDGKSAEEGTKSSESVNEKTETAKKIFSLIIVGQLHYQTGNIAAAETAFRKVLELDGTNQLAKDFLNRCADARRLQDEKKKQIELYEKLLELDEKEEELKEKSDSEKEKQ